MGKFDFLRQRKFNTHGRLREGNRAKEGVNLRMKMFACKNSTEGDDMRVHLTPQPFVSASPRHSYNPA